MTKKDIKELEHIVLAPIKRKEKQQKIHKILRNNKCITIMKELRLLKSEFTNQQYNKAVLIVVLAFLFRNIAMGTDIRLLLEGDELQANIAFTHCVREIRLDVEDYHDLEKCPEYARVKSKKQIYENIKKHLDVLDEIMTECTDERKCSLLLNYILYEKAYPHQLGVWLMKKDIQNSFINELTETSKVKTLDDLYTLCELVKCSSCKTEEGKNVRKDKYYDALVKKLKYFIRERNGIYNWDAGKAALFKKICYNLPKHYRYILKNFLEQESKKYMVSKLDEMVRYKIYLADIQQWEICQGMLKQLRDCL